MLETTLSIHNGQVTINGVQLKTMTDLKLHVSPTEPTSATISFDVTDLDADFSQLDPQ